MVVKMEVAKGHAALGQGLDRCVSHGRRARRIRLGFVRRNQRPRYHFEHIATVARARSSWSTQTAVVAFALLECALAIEVGLGLATAYTGRAIARPRRCVICLSAGPSRCCPCRAAAPQEIAGDPQQGPLYREMQNHAARDRPRHEN